MGATDTVIISDYSDWMKEWYLPIIKKARERINPFLDEAVTKFDHSHIAGETAYWATEFPSGAGVGSRAENALNPIPDAGDYAQASVQLTTNLAIMQLSIQLMKQSEGDRAAFNPAVAQVVSTVMDNYLRNMNRMTLGNADGKLAQVDTTVSTTSITVDNAWGIDNTDAGSAANGQLFLEKNAVINFFNGDAIRSGEGASSDGVCHIASINTLGSGATSAIITLVTASAAIANGDYIHLDGNKHDSSGSVYEPDGLRLIIDDSDDNYGGIDTGSDNHPDWKSWVHYGESAGTVEPLTRARMNGPFNDIRRKSNGMPNLMFMGSDTLETYLELADSMNITTNASKLDVAGNWEGPTFRGMTMLDDPIYPETRMEYIDTKNINIVQSEPADWVPGDVGILQKVANRLNYVAEYLWMMNMIGLDRTKFGSLRDIELTS